jgi:Domain of unknown function (DUF4124)
MVRKKLRIMMTLFLILFFTLPAWSAVYTWKDKGGNAIISSSPPPPGVAPQEVGEEKESDRYVNSGQYVNKEHGISFKVPTGRSVDTSGKPKNVLIAYAQNQSLINLEYGELGEGESYVLILAKLQAAMLEKVGGRIVRQPRELTINGRKAVELGATAHPAYAGLTYLIADESKNKVYQLGLTTSQARYETTARDFMEVVYSFQIR